MDLEEVLDFGFITDHCSMQTHPTHQTNGITVYARAIRPVSKRLKLPKYDGSLTLVFLYRDHLGNRGLQHAYVSRHTNRSASATLYK